MSLAASAVAVASITSSASHTADCVISQAVQLGPGGPAVGWPALTSPCTSSLGEHPASPVAYATY